MACYSRTPAMLPIWASKRFPRTQSDMFIFRLTIFQWLSFHCLQTTNLLCNRCQQQPVSLHFHFHFHPSLRPFQYLYSYYRRTRESLDVSYIHSTQIWRNDTFKFESWMCLYSTIIYARALYRDGKLVVFKWCKIWLFPLPAEPYSLRLLSMLYV